jgi:hypothetical protein
MTFTANIAAAQDSAGLSLAGGRFGEINLKFGYEFESYIQGIAEFEFDMGSGVQKCEVRETQPTSSGIFLGLEYLYAIPFGSTSSVLYPGFLKIGAGVNYLFPRQSRSDVDRSTMTSEEVDFSLLPIYGIIQLNPTKVIPGLFAKGMAGYSLFTEWSSDEPVWGDKKGGLHWGLAVGYECDWGLFVEYDYTQTHFACNMPSFNADTNFTYSKSGLTIGYKLKL